MDKIKIQKIKLSDLYNFINSEEYNSLITKPISTSRALSYIKNTRATNNSYVLYLAFINKQLVGFRTILNDTIFINSQTFNFGWLSGSWVKPDLRRQGISFCIFNEVFKDWNGMLAYSNYNIASKSLFDKSNKFKPIYKKNGLRIYSKPNIYRLLKDRVGIIKKLKYLVLFTESLIYLATIPYMFLLKLLWKNKLKYVSINDTFSDDIQSFINQNPQSCFMRNSSDYKWIFNYPWIKKQSEDINYPFSYKYKLLKTSFLTTKDEYNKINGLAIIKNYDGEVSVPYFYSQQSNKTLINAIIAWFNTNKSDYTTLYNPLLTNALRKKHFIGLWHKNINQSIFASQILYNKLSASLPTLNFQDGDGDSIFT